MGIVETNVGPGRRRRVTLADVAAKAKVSLATVSQVLNQRASCWASEETRQRVRAAARELRYRPHLPARSLRSGETRTLGMITTALGLGSARNRFTGVEEAAEKEGYTLMLSFHPNLPDTEDQRIRSQLDRGVDGLLVYPSERGPHTELLQLVESGFPVVTFDGAALLDFPCDDVSPDYAGVGRMQARHLLDLGRRRFCIANALPAARINVIREEAACAELAAAGVSAPLFMNIERPGEPEIGALESVDQPVAAFLREHRGRFDAVIAYDSVAALVVRNLLRLGMKVPGDVAVIGAGNSLIGEYNTLPLSTITTGDHELGREAFGLLLERLHRPEGAGAFRRIVRAPVLLARESTVGPAAQK